jgi:hypothetical protein
MSRGQLVLAAVRIIPLSHNTRLTLQCRGDQVPGMTFHAFRLVPLKKRFSMAHSDHLYAAIIICESGHLPSRERCRIWPALDTRVLGI